MLSFIGPCPDNHEVNHISGDKNNNCLKNLEYITPSENRLHSFAIGLESNKGENHSQNKLTEKNVHEIRLRLIKGETQKSIASSFHVAAPTISSISTRRNWGWLK